MKIRRRHMPVLAAAGVVVGLGLALLLALVVGAGVARAAGYPDETGDMVRCETVGGYSACCTIRWSDWGTRGHQWCSGSYVTEVVGCPTTIEIRWDYDADPPLRSVWCSEPVGGSIWLADVCEPDDGFSVDGWMTWDSGYEGPLQVGASMEGPWYDAAVNGPQWALNEEMLESFATMVGVEDWHDLWLRSGEGYPQHVGNAVLERDGRMDALCAE